jgi:hypothetical protein
MDTPNYEKSTSPKTLTIMQQWLQLTDKEKIEVYTEIAARTGMTPQAVEKDWWVTTTLNLVFSTTPAEHLVFKGGTSLSKAWDLIERFSEDIDLALDRKYLGFEGPMTPTQVKKLRKVSYKYISEVFYPELAKLFEQNGMPVELRLRQSKDSDQDPLIIEIYYPHVFEYNQYIEPRVLVEIGSRSLREPFSHRSIASLVAKHFPELPFADTPFEIATVNPERTLLEKVFLLHEEFQKPTENIRVERLSRHLYDIDRLIVNYGPHILENKTLYQEIVAHRRTITPVRGIDYDRHKPEFINCIPPEAIIAEWRKDYIVMQEQMIFGTSHSFEDLVQNIINFRVQINALNWNLEA